MSKKLPVAVTLQPIALEGQDSDFLYRAGLCSEGEVHFLLYPKDTNACKILTGEEPSCGFPDMMCDVVDALRDAIRKVKRQVIIRVRGRLVQEGEHLLVGEFTLVVAKARQKELRDCFIAYAHMVREG